MNYFDLATAEGRTFTYFGKALGDVRENVFYQIHFGANYSAGTCGWSTDGETVKQSISWQLEKLGTDYIDYGFIHCIDELSDWQEYQENGALAYIMFFRRADAGCGIISFWKGIDNISVCGNEETAYDGRCGAILPGNLIKRR